MNYLAHLLLAEDRAESRIGNLLGDFVLGRPESLSLPAPVIHGIIRHRAIDRFTDSHPVNARLKLLVDPQRRRFAGVISDVIHDHFLIRHWPQFSPHPIREFIDLCNRELREHATLLPSELADSLEERIADDWLGRLGTDAGLDTVFRKMVARRPRSAPIRHALDDLRRHRGEFEDGFFEFFPDLQSWIRDLGPESSAPIDLFPPP